MSSNNVNQFGRGLLCPFQRDQKGDFANGGGIGLLASDVGELLGIAGPYGDLPGEVPWRTDLGSRLDALRHRQMHAEIVRARAEHMTAGVLRKFEKRVRSSAVQVLPGTADGSLTVRFSFTTFDGTQGPVFFDRAVGA
jgi:hypothetical protein